MQPPIPRGRNLRGLGHTGINHAAALSRWGLFAVIGVARFIFSHVLRRQRQKKTGYSGNAHMGLGLFVFGLRPVFNDFVDQTKGLGILCVGGTIDQLVLVL
jgi:hypothetical protein